ncbi:MAG: hypothetical protein ACP5M5_13300, partial [Acidibrevibacterium sp.]|uniref:hypothetical protein n=1 Tax=Acidibrevibacterium sp. TaxID=2606776 RepID=UPI003D02D00A
FAEIAIVQHANKIAQVKANCYLFVCRISNKRRSAAIDPPRVGSGKASIPGARRNRHGGSETMRQPATSISIARHESLQKSRYKRPSCSPTRRKISGSGTS